MLRQLHVTDLGVIHDLDLHLDPGLNVLTGETGAGKTLLTVAVSLAVGVRASAHLVRPGAGEARVQAVFDAPAGAEDWAEDDELVLARSVGADGRSRARVGGQIATASALADLGRRVVEVHGQHQTLGLMEASVQAGFLDRFAGEEHLGSVRALASTVARSRATDDALHRLAEAARDRERELDLLAYQVREIEAVAPREGETESLQVEEARLGHAERLLESAAAAERAIAGEGGASDAVAGAAAALASIAELDPTATDLAARAGGLASELQEIGRELRHHRESLVVDPARLQEVRERLASLKSLQRKYGETDADVLTFGARSAEQLAGLAGADERLAQLLAEAERLHAAVDEAAALVTAGRERAEPGLAQALTTELHDLGMPAASVVVALERLERCGPEGMERVELRLAAGEHQPPLPLARAASGGELSRVMLACRSVLADLDDVATLVFDEVDAGIGGEAGLAVGRRLARLATTRQVLVVTHLPQIACFADRHVRVRKQGGLAAASVLEGEARVQELSRMLAGLEGSEHAASHAQELLAEASARTANA